LTPQHRRLQADHRSAQPGRAALERGEEFGYCTGRARHGVASIDVETAQMGVLALAKGLRAKDV